MSKNISELTDSGGLNVTDDLFVVRRTSGTPQDYKLTPSDLINVVRSTETTGITYDLTISSGSITVDPLHAPTSAYHVVDTEAAAASDNLDTIIGTKMGQVLTIQTKDNTRVVTVRDGIGNIFLSGGNFVMDNTKDTLQLVYNSTLNRWCETSRSNVA